MATLCVQCGIDVTVDNDGCCALCGATAVGPYADAVCELLAACRDPVWSRRNELIDLLSRAIARGQT